MPTTEMGHSWWLNPVSFWLNCCCFVPSYMHQQPRMDHEPDYPRAAPGKNTALPLNTASSGFNHTYLFSLHVFVSSGCFGRSVQWKVCSGTQTFNRKLPAAGEHWGLVSLACGMTRARWKAFIRRRGEKKKQFVITLVYLQGGSTSRTSWLMDRVTCW